MMTGRTAAIGVALLVGGLSGCIGGGGSSGSGSGSGGGAPTTLGCENLTWSATQVDALERVRIEGISGTFASEVADADAALYAEARVTGNPDDPFLPLPLFVEDDGSDVVLSMPAPLNTDDLSQPQSYDVSLVAGDVSCDGPTVQIGGIGSGTGNEFSDYLGSTKDLLVEEAAAYGYTTYTDLQNLRNAVLGGAELPPVGMLSVLLVVDALEQFEARAQSLSGLDREALEAYMAHLDFSGAMLDYSGVLTGLGPEPQQSGTGGSLSSFGGTGSVVIPLGSGGGSVTPMNGACAAITGDPVTIADAFELDYYMREQQAAADALSGHSGALREAAMAGTPLLGLVSGGAATAAGLLLYIEYSIKDFSANTLPSKFTQMGFDVHPGSDIPEDYELAGKTAFWDNAYVNAQSEGHDMTGMAIDALSQLIGAGRYLKGLDVPDSALNSAKGFITDVGQNEVFSEAKDRSGSADCLTIPPQDWSGIDVTDSAWTESRVYGEAFTLGARQSHRQDLSLQKIGTAELVVETRDDKFGGVQDVANYYISVREQQVTWSPAAVHVDNLGDTFDYTITVDHTERPYLVPTIDPPPGVTVLAGPSDLGGGTFFVRLQSPSDKEHYTATVPASRPGVLEPIAERTGETHLLSEQRLTVTPPTACIQPGESVTLTAEVLGFEDTDQVNWNVLSGPGTVSPVVTTGTNRTASVTSTGSDGIIDVEAVAAADSDVRDTSRISVGSCDAPLHVWGAFTVSADAGSEDSDYNSADENRISKPPEPPQRPANYWQGRVERFSSAENATGEMLNWGVNVHANSEGILTLASDGNGGMTYRHEVPAMADECIVNPDPEESDVSCSRAGGGGGGVATYYMDLEATGTYDVTIEGQCSYTGDAYAGASVSLFVWRYYGDLPEEGGPLNGPFMDYPDYDYGEFYDPQVLSNQDVGNICGSGHNGTFTFTRSFDVGPPVEPDEPDMVYIQVGLGSVAGTNHYAGSDITEYINFSGGVATFTPPGDEESAGNYNGTADMELNVSVSRR